METDKPITDSNDDDEPREYSSPACYLHEFEQQPTAAAKTATKHHTPAGSENRESPAPAEPATPIASKRPATP